MTVEQYFSERRLPNKLLAYWNSIRGDRHHPSVEEIDPDAILEIWPNCFIVKVTVSNGVPEYKFQYLGENIRNAYKGENSIHQGLNVEFSVPVVSHEISTMKDCLDEVFEGLEHVVEEIELVLGSDLVLKVRQCFLPLGTKEEEIDAIIGAMSYKIVATK